jgi:PGF-pre-PGF domain-containing protein
MPFVVTSSSPANSFDMKNTTTDSGDSSVVVDDKSSDTGDGSVVVDDKTSDSGDSSVVVDDKSSYSDGSVAVDDKLTDSNDDSLIMDNTSKNSSINTYLHDTYYAPDERAVPIEEIVSIAENKIGNLSNGQEKEVAIEYFDDMDSVKLTPTTNLEEVKITIIKLKDKPEEIIDPPKKNISVYKYLDIKLTANDTYLEEADINLLEFKFKVEKTWINNNKIDKETIKLIRYHDSKWQNLSTTLNSENETFVFYNAESPGCSTFAVVGSKVVEKSESYATDEIHIPWSIIFAFIISLIIMLVIFLFKARYIYIKED